MFTFYLAYLLVLSKCIFYFNALQRRERRRFRCTCCNARLFVGRECKCDALNAVRRLTVHHKDVLCPQLHPITVAVVAEVLARVFFLPRDAMRKRGTNRLPVSVCLSVRHTRVLYRNGYRYHQSFFSAR